MVSCEQSFCDGDVQQRLNSHAHFDQAFLFKDVMRQTELFLGGRRTEHQLSDDGTNDRKPLLHHGRSWAVHCCAACFPPAWASSRCHATAEASSGWAGKITGCSTMVLNSTQSCIRSKRVRNFSPKNGVTQSQKHPPRKSKLPPLASNVAKNFSCFKGTRLLMYTDYRWL